MSHRRILISLLGAVALVSGCGSSDDKGLLAAKDSRALLRSLEAAERSANAQRCNEARSRARDGLQRAQGLPTRVDRDVRRNLEDGFEHLIEQIDVDCEQKEQPTPTPTPSPSPSPTPTVEETPEPTPTPTATEEPTATPAPEEPIPTPDAGGSQGPDGEVGDG